LLDENRHRETIVVSMTIMHPPYYGQWCGDTSRLLSLTENAALAGFRETASCFA
jgi:hypothetical protein